jgi:predicted enzyme related to lactoylglutathione lyase
MIDSHARFVWYELMTTDTAAAKAFYTNVVGWETDQASTPDLYTFYCWQGPVSGLLELPENALKVGVPPHWIGYVRVDNVDSAAERIKQLGGAVNVPPTDVPNISRFSIVADPQMATFALIKGLKPGRERPAELGKPGYVGWHELLATDWEKAFASGMSANSGLATMRGAGVRMALLASGVLAGVADALRDQTEAKKGK